MSLSKKGTTTKTLLEKNVLTLYRLIKKLSTISFFSKHDPLFDRPPPYPSLNTIHCLTVLHPTLCIKKKIFHNKVKKVKKF